MDARTQNETLFADVPVQHRRIAGGDSIRAVEDYVADQRERNETRSSDRQILEERSARLGAVLADLPPGERLGRFRNEIGGKLVFTTSLGLEDQVILHLLAERNIDVDIVTLDTSRLFSPDIRTLGGNRTPLRKAHSCALPAATHTRSLDRGVWHQRVLRFPKSSVSLLWYPQT